MALKLPVSSNTILIYSSHTNQSFLSFVKFHNSRSEAEPKGNLKVDYRKTDSNIVTHADSHWVPTCTCTVWLTQNYICVYKSIETAYSIKPTCLKTEEFHHKSNCQPVQEEFIYHYTLAIILFSWTIRPGSIIVYGQEKLCLENQTNRYLLTNN